MRSRVGPAVISTRRHQQRLQPLREIKRLEHAAFAALATGLIPHAGPEDLHTAAGEGGDVGARCGIGPHQMIHGRRHRNRCLGRKTQGRQQIVRQSRGEPCQKIRTRGRDQYRVRPARQLDVTHRRFGRGVPQIAADGAARNRLEGGRGDKFARRPSHHDLHLSAVLAQASHEVRALVGGDATGDAKEYVLALHGSWSRSRNYRTLPREGRKPPCAGAKWTHSERFLPLAAGLRACLD